MEGLTQGVCVLKFTWEKLYNKRVNGVFKKSDRRQIRKVKVKLLEK